MSLVMLVLSLLLSFAFQQIHCSVLGWHWTPGANAAQKVGDRVGPLALEWDLGGIT